MTIGVLALCGLLCVVIGLALTRSVAAPLHLITQAVDRIVSGDLDVTVVGTERKEEIGLLARAPEVFRRNAMEARRLAAALGAMQAAA